MLKRFWDKIKNVLANIAIVSGAVTGIHETFQLILWIWEQINK